MKTQTRWLTVLLAAGVAGTAWAQAVRTLRYKGQVVSQGVRVLDGQPYVPLRDVARMLGDSVVKGGAGGGYELQASGADATTADAAGGANQVGGRAGRIGQPVFDGFWRVTVLAAPQLMDSYPTQYMQSAKTFTPDNPTDTLVAVSCLFKNGTKNTQSWAWGYDTALTDDQGQSYPARGCDMRYSGPTTPDILPGAAFKAVLLFSVPKGTTLKDLVISTTPSGDHGKPSDIRIPMTP